MNRVSVFLKRVKTSWLLLRHNPFLLKELLMGKLKLFFSSNKESHKMTHIGNIHFDLNFNFLVSSEDIKEKYLHCYEMAIVHYMKKVLKPGDVFIDVGANVGYLSAIGANAVGKQGSVHAFEPIPLYASHIDKWAAKNQTYCIKVNRAALSNNSGTANINVSRPPFTGNSGFVRDPQCAHVYQGEVEVPLTRLDTYLSENEVDHNKVKLIKIDVEGYEIPVLLGLKKFFESTNNRPDIICEIKADLYSILGYSINDLKKYLSEFGYKAYHIYAPNKGVSYEVLKQQEMNVIFRCH